MKRSSKEIVSPETDENYVAKYMVWGKNIVVVLVQKRENTGSSGLLMDISAVGLPVQNYSIPEKKRRHQMDNPEYSLDNKKWQKTKPWTDDDPKIDDSFTLSYPEGFETDIERAMKGEFKRRCIFDGLPDDCQSCEIPLTVSGDYLFCHKCGRITHPTQ